MRTAASDRAAVAIIFLLGCAVGALVTGQLFHPGVTHAQSSGMAPGVMISTYGPWVCFTNNAGGIWCGR